MKKAIIFFILGLQFQLTGQEMSGVIEYNRKVDWNGIYETLPFLTEEQKDRRRLTWGTDENDGTNYMYHFNSKMSTYAQKEEENEGNYSWANEEFFLIRDYRSETLTEWREMLGKKYLVKDKIPKYKWKILNEIKEVEGYLCMKARTVDEIRGQTIDVWFTDQINYSGGPEGFDGLPGMILELSIDEGNVNIVATNIDLAVALDKLDKPKKMKGKELSSVEFKEIIKKYVDESIFQERNPYWRIRY